MSEETRLVLQALIGLMVAVITAFLTNWLNRRYFREQLGEQRYFEVYLDKMLELWERILEISYEVPRLGDELYYKVEEMCQEGNAKQEIDKELTSIYYDRLGQISTKVVALQSYYFLLKQPAIDALKGFDRILKLGLSSRDVQHNFRELRKASRELNDCREKAFTHIRRDLADLTSRKTTVSEILSTEVDITPPSVKEWLSDPADKDH